MRKAGHLLTADRERGRMEAAMVERSAKNDSERGSRMERNRCTKRLHLPPTTSLLFRQDGVAMVMGVPVGWGSS